MESTQKKKASHQHFLMACRPTAALLKLCEPQWSRAEYIEVRVGQEIPEVLPSVSRAKDCRATCEVSRFEQLHYSGRLVLLGGLGVVHAVGGMGAEVGDEVAPGAEVFNELLLVGKSV